MKHESVELVLHWLCNWMVVGSNLVKSEFNFLFKISLFMRFWKIPRNRLAALNVPHGNTKTLFFVLFAVQEPPGAALIPPGAKL